jgi:multiple sugar transport system substrate-binding protein
LKALPEVEYPLDLKMNYGVGEWFTYGFSPILQSFGGDLIDRSNYQTAEGVLNGPEAVKAMTWFQSLFTRGYADPEPPGDDSFYGTKTAALSAIGHWGWGNNNQGLGDDLILLPVPKFGPKHVSGMGSWNWGITSSCPNPDEAWTFMEYLVNTDNTLAIANTNGGVPARKSSIAQSELYKEGGRLNIFVQQLESIALERPVTPAYPVITAAFAEAVQNIVAGEDVQEQLDIAVQKIDQDIEDNEGYPMME